MPAVLTMACKRDPDCSTPTHAGRGFTSTALLRHARQPGCRRTHDFVGGAVHLDGHAVLEVVGGDLGSAHHQGGAASGHTLQNQQEGRRRQAVWQW